MSISLRMTTHLDTILITATAFMARRSAGVAEECSVRGTESLAAPACALAKENKGELYSDIMARDWG